MTFEKDTSMDCIDFKDGDIADVVDESIKQPVEVIPTCWPSIVVMIWCQAKEVCHVRTHSLKDLPRFFS